MVNLSRTFIIHDFNMLEPTITPMYVTRNKCEANVGYFRSSDKVLIMEAALNLLIVWKFILLLNYINETRNEK